MNYNELIELMERKYGKIDEKQFKLMSHYPYENKRSVIYIDTGRKPTIEEINEQIWKDVMNPDLVLWNDEEAFLNHLIKKWMEKDE